MSCAHGTPRHVGFSPDCRHVAPTYRASARVFVRASRFATDEACQRLPRGGSGALFVESAADRLQRLGPATSNGIDGRQHLMRAAASQSVQALYGSSTSRMLLPVLWPFAD